MPSLAAGMKIGPYEIQSALGVGGMGEVYRARDTKLNRDVALKVLPEAFSRDLERRARFQREAQLLAALNHPQIATIHGIEETDERITLVMELVEGPTLAERLAHHGGRALSSLPALPDPIGPGLPIGEAVAIAKQLCDAIEYAHERGIVHRDLKPANIKLKVRGAHFSGHVGPHPHAQGGSGLPPRTEDILTSRGDPTPARAAGARLERRLPAADVADCTVKVLDFGLAKALDQTPTATSVSHSPTLSVAATREGMILGTAAYMAPEQARGLDADRRSDIWAFGCVLFEMLTGKQAFSGNTISDTLAAVLRADPEWTSLPLATPVAVRRLLRRCLEKDAKRRLQHIGDARLELDEPDAIQTDAQPAAERTRRSIWPLMVASAAGAAIAGFAGWMLAPGTAPAPVRRFTIPIPAAAAQATTGGFDIALSPDGRTLVVAYPSVGLVKRQLDGLSLEPVRGAEGGTSPFFSPDGTWIGFRAEGKLKKVPTEGGLATTICDAPGGPAVRATWGDDGSIIMTRDTDLYEVPSTGGTPKLFLKSDNDGMFAQPRFIPGSKAVLVQRGSREARIEAIELQARARHPLVEGTNPQLAATGHLVFEQRGGIWAVKFDPKRLAVVGAPVPVVESVRFTFGNQALFSAARDGSLAYIAGNLGTNRSLVWIDRAGKTTAALQAQGGFQSPRLSPDGKRVVVSVSDGSNLDLWSYEFERGTRLRLTTSGSNRRNVWSPDGTQIAFYATPLQRADQDLYVMPSTGGEPKRLLARPGPQFPDTWSPDGRFLVFAEIEGAGGGRGRDLWLLPIGEPPRPLLVTRFYERGAVFSPDGRWLAFVTDEPGRAEVYVQPFPGPGPKVPISTNGGLQPMWSRDGRELFYREGDSLMAVPIQLDPIRVGAARKLFELPGATYNLDQNFADYDLAPDGRFLAIRSDSEAQVEIQIVLNWTEELRRALER